MKTLGNLAGLAGRGIVAGLVGTAAMTVSSTLEMKWREREASDVPTKAAGRVLGVQPRDPEGASRFGTAIHWGYGAAMGGLGGLLRSVLSDEPAATGVHFGAVWGAEMVGLPNLGVVPPVTEWGVTEVAIDGWHHLVYAAGFAIAWQALKP